MNKAKVLVTGASGFLGRRTVEILSERGFSVRALVRQTSTIGNLKRPGVEIFFGDVSDIYTLKPAFEGIDFVVHTAVDTSGTKEGAQRVTIGGTRNILDLCSNFPIRKLVYISSLSVYGLADCKDGQVIDENAALERYPERRGVYSWSKIEAEKLVRDCIIQRTVPVVCLRPGTIYGPGGKLFTPMMGFSFGTKLFVIIGPGDFVLPLVYIDNLINAVVSAIQKRQSIGNIYNVVDPDNPTKKQYVDSVLKKLHPGSKFIYLPCSICFAIVFPQEIFLKLLGMDPFVSRYRLFSIQKKLLYHSSKIKIDLNWTPSYSFKQALFSLQAT
jgi:2-alkyl-3-oxoalkanoate reductase